MEVAQTVAGVREALREAPRPVEFVPTMGALHDGHLSLVRRARERAAVAGGTVVASIFVNPAQFGQAEDFEAYPRDLPGDLAALRREGVAVVFTPPVSEMYPRGAVYTEVDPGPIGELCEGRYRPGHFRGVATVCVKLFSIVQPERVYLGRKDAQQVAVLRRVVSDLNLPVEIVECPTVREPDGLAMSSRNLRLDPAERQAASVLYRGLCAARALGLRGETEPRLLRAAAEEVIGRQPLVSLQYVDVVNPRTFQPVDSAAEDSLMVLAAFVGPVRLIDNLNVGTRSAGPNEEADP